MNIKQATKKLEELKKLKDGKEYCITLGSDLKLRVGEKTEQQKIVDQNGLDSDKLITDWINDYNVIDDLH